MVWIFLWRLVKEVRLVLSMVCSISESMKDSSYNAWVSREKIIFQQGLHYLLKILGRIPNPKQNHDYYVSSKFIYKFYLLSMTLFPTNFRSKFPILSLQNLKSFLLILTPSNIILFPIIKILSIIWIGIQGILIMNKFMRDICEFEIWFTIY